MRDQVQITENNLSPAIQICTVIFIIPTVLAVGGRIFTKLAFVRKLDWDDYMVFVAFIFSLGQAATVFLCCANGLGQPWTTLSDSQKITFQKSSYASGLLLIWTLVLTKLSIISFIQNLTPNTLEITVGHCMGVFLVFWGLASEFAAAFQCSVPNVWKQEGNKCFSIILFWECFFILNIFTDLVLIIWPAIVIGKVRTGWHRRIIIIICFACRFFVIGASIAQVIFLHRARGSHDLTFSSWQLAICTQLMQCLSIGTACIPYLRPFLDSLESGLLRSDDLRRRGMVGAYGYGGTPSMFSSGKKTINTSKTSKTSKNSHSHINPSTDEIPLTPRVKWGAGSSTKIQANPHHAWDNETISSRAEITLSTTWSVKDTRGSG
ncbi:uncharacterized protein BP5553_09465 [Venustampulla echinocandica]|uniref:Rhodopsin domain-containing protein n=1 Tax=Venustampulla echinocandica TaxID=2656787 RepID=A0A370TCS8_9HELO|nr:uncharacterized protein BP5553_09465 [Venustampulla echinocandica]RDL32063.1 hypothetical protein BP5553_09465 [Venustampulla echinocandica]